MSIPLKTFFFFALITSLACQNEAHPQSDKQQVETLPGANKTIDPTGGTIKVRFQPPAGYTRASSPENSFAGYLQNFPLLPAGTKVHLYDGRLKSRQDVHLAVLDIDVGKRDLQQCADATMRLRAEFLYRQKRYDEISFKFTNGFPAAYARWRKGERIKVSGNRVNWVSVGKNGDSPASFRRYLTMVFSYAGTLSLANELPGQPLENIEIGNVFVQGGSPGHAVIVVDKATNAAGETVVLLAQSYMPAQQIHVLRNPAKNSDDGWYRTSEMRGVFATPEWQFQGTDLKRFTP